MGSTLPSELGELKNLKGFEVSGNADLQGLIPKELGLLTQLEVFDISSTQISGKVPETLCGLVDVTANCSLVECCA